MDLECNRSEKKANKRLNTDDLSSSDNKIKRKCIEKSKLLELNLYNLPNELLLSIFSYLNSVDLMDICLTCERFFNICYEKKLWKTINIRKIYLTKNIFKQYMNFAGSHTEEIFIIGNDQDKNLVTFDYLYEIKVKCPNLQILHLENQSLDALEIFVSVFPPLLKELSLANCTLQNVQYTQRFFSGIDSYFTNLETLILTNCCWFSTHSIMAISKLPKLKYLYLDGCEQLCNFMPYLSLSTRYGFKCLEMIDLSRTMVSDSEVTCFTAAKTLKALFLERITAPKISVKNKEQYVSENTHDEIINNDALNDELSRLSEIVPEMENIFKINDSPKAKILKSNFTSILQEIGKNYTKKSFHQLFCNIEYLKKLILLEIEDKSNIISINKNDFKPQKRFSKTENDDCYLKIVDNSVFDKREGENNSTPCISVEVNPDCDISTKINCYVGNNRPIIQIPAESNSSSRTLPSEASTSTFNAQHSSPKKILPTCNASQSSKNEPSCSSSASNVNPTVNVISINPQPSCSRHNSTLSNLPQVEFDSEYCRIIVQNQLDFSANSPSYPIYKICRDDDYCRCASPLLDKDFIKKLKQITHQTNDTDIECFDLQNTSNGHGFRSAITVHAENNVVYTISQRMSGGSNVSDGSSISNRTLHALFNQRSECINLEQVSFRGYRNITDEGLFYLTHAPQTINYIDLRGTGVTKAGCSRFKIQRPWCQLICDFDV